MKTVVNTFKELKNISWPRWTETFSKTFIVIVFSLFIGIITATVAWGFGSFGGVK